MSYSNDPAAWMWRQACELIDQAERLQRQFFRLGTPERAQATWEPPVDVFENEREIVMVVAMPGVAVERVQVLSEAGTLVVRGVRPLPFIDSRQRVRQLEIPYGAFERRIALPPGRLKLDPPESIQGCLVLRLQKIDRSGDE
ncbi:MAG TPA: Hsp20/alpha crystallin family protein [Rubrivivax sp.]|nr:Hsp20/alpha crystallin family protein [Rubrivivax sp.]